MNQRKKRFAAWALAVCLIMTLLPSAGLAAEDDLELGTLHYTEVIAPQYENAGFFSDGLAAVKKDGKWGYIDQENNVVIPFVYDAAGIFNEGYAVVGKLVFSEPIQDYDPVTDKFYDTGAYWNTYELGFIDQTGKYTDFVYDYYYNEETGGNYSGPLTYVTEEDQFPNDMCFYNGYISLPWPDSPDMLLYNTTGREVNINQDWLTSLGWQVTENTLIIGNYAVEGGDQSYLNLETGNRITVNVPENSFAELRPFNQGIAMAGVYTWDDMNFEYIGKWGVINQSGDFIIQPAYTNFMVSDVDQAYEVFGPTGLAIVQNESGKWGAIDKTGTVQIPFQYDHIYNYDFGLAAFDIGGKWGYLDANGEIAIPAQYAMASPFGSNGYAVAYDGTKAFLIDVKGNAIPGADMLDADTYFIQEEGDDTPLIYTPSDYVVIEENGLFGYGHIEYRPALPEPSAMSSWAYEEVTAAIEENLVPNYLQNLYLNNINRNEFCDLVIQAIQEVTDQDISDIVKEQTGRDLFSWQKEYPFSDSTSSNVIAAYALGIVSGRGNGIFDPYASITRQEAAAFLMRSAKVLGMDTTQIVNAGFQDDGSVGVWFKDAVNFVYQINVMSGTGDNTFTPLGNYTREQSYTTIYRLFLAITQQQ